MKRQPAPRLVRPVATVGLSLWAAIGISAALHVVPLTVLSFVYPEKARNLRDQALDIILVNARSAKKPVDAQAIAQANLDGGGTVDENRRAKTPLPPTALQTNGSDIEQMKRRVSELEAAQQRLLASARSKTTSRPNETESSQADAQPAISGQDLLETAKAMARLEGEISKSLDEYNKRPRKLFPGVRALASERAAYEDAWRLKVERIGTFNYPPEARGKVYGSLILSVTVDRDGHVLEVTVDRSSGKKVLDDAARRIVRMGSPYGPLPPAIRQQYDNLVIVRTWSFTQGDTVEARQ
ncbi:MAG TPA: energy transducer TonB [Rhodocyclaceae bacterium]|nr:energy transducer TonB [Rhodocyclaceae bacterium]